LKQVPSQASPDEIFLLAVDQQNGEHAVRAIKGWRVMEVIRDGDIDLTATCEDTCAGCYVYDRPSLERLPAADEEDRLYQAFGVEPASRLCCQILMSPGLSGCAWASRWARNWSDTDGSARRT
jgi:ferredoxin, 2Fe-2S